MPIHAFSGKSNHAEFLREFCEEEKAEVRAGGDLVKNHLDDPVRHPVAERIRHRANKRVLLAHVVGHVRRRRLAKGQEAVGVERWVKALLVPAHVLSEVAGVAVGARVKAPRDGIDRMRGPVYLLVCFVEDEVARAVGVEVQNLFDRRPAIEVRDRDADFGMGGRRPDRNSISRHRRCHHLARHSDQHVPRVKGGDAVS